MRRRVNGMLLPGVVLTVLSSLGVGALLSAGVPVLPEGFSPLPRSDKAPERRQVAASSSPSQEPRPPAPPAPSPTSTAHSGRGGHTPTVAPPTTAGPVVPSTSKPTRKPVPPPPTTRPPAPPSCRAGSATVRAVADSYVDQARPRETYHGPSLLVASRDKDRNRRALVRFAVPSLPSGCDLRAATLTMTAKEATGRRLNVARAGKAWRESDVSWYTAPRPAGAPVGTRLSGTRAVWDVTAQVAAGAGYGFVVYDASEGSKANVPQANLGGRDSRTPPTLTIRWG